MNWNPESDFLPDNLKHGAVTIGNFDGVHLGHAQILHRLKAHGLPIVIFTFATHPRQILCQETAPEQLTLNERKEYLLRSLGADEVIFAPTQKILNWTADEFFRNVIIDFLDAQVIVEGANFAFGKKRSGNTALLREFCENSGRKLEIIHDLLEFDGASVSSSRIRKHISRGEIREANALLTAPYQLEGNVIHGLARGRTMGFPTANLGGIQTIIPAHGVYACRACLQDGASYPAAVHIGPNLTFHETENKVEIFLLHFSGNIYSQCLKIDFLEKLRDLADFHDSKKLMEQIQCNIRETERVFDEFSMNFN